MFLVLNEMWEQSLVGNTQMSEMKGSGQFQLQSITGEETEGILIHKGGGGAE